MKNILFINGCMRGENSRTIKLANAFISTLKNNDVNIIEKNLCVENINYLNGNSFDDKTGEQNSTNKSLAMEFAMADQIILAAPYWEFLFPSVINCYFENVSVAGVTFKYTDKGSVGLCNANKFTYIYTAGDYIKNEDKINEMYLKKLTTLYGINNFEVIMADGLDLDFNDSEKIVDDICKKIINK